MSDDVGSERGDRVLATVAARRDLEIADDVAPERRRDEHRSTCASALAGPP